MLHRKRQKLSITL